MLRKPHWIAFLSLSLSLFGCRDAQSPTGLPANDTQVAASETLRAHFLPPLAFRPVGTETKNVQLDPVVEICEVVDRRCAERVAARFTTRTAPGSETIRMSQTEGGHYVVNWHTDRFALKNGAIYRIRVFSEEQELGSVDVRLAGQGSPPSAGSLVSFVYGQTLPIRFRIEGSADQSVVDSVQLTVVHGPGVTGSPTSGDSGYKPGTKVRYAFDASPGYENVRVMLDGDYVDPRGTLTMDQAHLLVATADMTVKLPPGREDLFQSARAILTSSNPAAAYQSHLNAVAKLFDEVGDDEATRQLAIIEFLAYDPVRDAAALVRVDAALAGREFFLTRESSLSIVKPGPLRSLDVTRNEVETPSTAYYVNGVLNDFTQAQGSTRALVSIVRETNAPSVTSVRLLYNRTYSAQMTSLEERTTMCLQDLARGEPFLGGLSLKFRYLRCLGDYAQHFTTNFDLVESARQVLELTNTTTLVSEADARSFGNVLAGEMKLGRNIILVPHSQGNLMVQQTINVLNASFKTIRDSRCISAVSLAAPMSTNWPLETGSDLLGVAVKGDMILWLGMNHFAQTETALSRQAEAEITGFEQLIPLIGPGPMVSAKLAKLKWGIRLHGAVASYMQQAETRQVIRSGIQRMATRSCGNLVLWGIWPSSTAECVQIWQYTGHFRLTARRDNESTYVTYELHQGGSFYPVYSGTATNSPGGFSFSKVTQDWTGEEVSTNYHTHRFTFTRDDQGWLGSLNHTHTLITDAGDQSSSRTCHTRWISHS
jgi:hypothetical protein